MDVCALWIEKYKPFLKKGTPFLRTFKGRMLRPGLTAQRYPSVVLGRKHGTRLVHRLVAEAFLGPRPEKHDVCHRDGSRDNNQVGNLYYGSRHKNIMDMKGHGVFKKKYEKMRKMSFWQYQRARYMRDVLGMTYISIAAAFKGLSPSGVRKRLSEGWYASCL